MSSSYIHFLDELRQNKTFLFLKNEENIEVCPLKTQVVSLGNSDYYYVKNVNSVWSITIHFAKKLDLEK